MNTESFIVYIKAEILQKILKLDLTLQIKNQTGRFKKEKRIK